MLPVVGFVDDEDAMFHGSKGWTRIAVRKDEPATTYGTILLILDESKDKISFLFLEHDHLPASGLNGCVLPRLSIL